MTPLRTLTRRAFTTIALAASLSGAWAQQFPDRPLTMIVPWGAGGGTDAVARMIATLMEKDLGQPVNVVNRTGGSGVVGHSAIATAPADGYTIGMITVEITMMNHQKLTELDPASYTPIALVNLDPAGFQVRADSPDRKSTPSCCASAAGCRASCRSGSPPSWSPCCAATGCGSRCTSRTPRTELTPEVAAACDMLADAGIPLGSQTVLLRGINDDPAVLKQLFHELLKNRVRPYYLYQADPVVGTAHLRTSIAKGLEIMGQLRGHTSGYAVPTYVVDAPGGGGKIPVQQDTIVSHQGGVWQLRNWAGEVFTYIDPPQE